jgi:hypothetical protein
MTTGKGGPVPSHPRVHVNMRDRGGFLGRLESWRQATLHDEDVITVPFSLGPNGEHAFP